MQIQLMQIPREENARADELSPLNPSDPNATMGVLDEMLNQPNMVEEQEVMVIDALDYRSPIIGYLKSPMVETDSQSTKLRIKAAKYTHIDEVLYKRSFSLLYLWFSRSDEAQYALRKIHKGICGQHMGG